MQVDISEDRSPAPQTFVQQSFIRRLTAFFVRLFERREIAQRIRIDFVWLVGGAYSGWMIFSSGFSSSIA
ncbi:MAG: hypothetical protein JOZ31_10520 [Verrucomicrobia bacterium]|nr:hypothetical protein [Verrucomicrobiota bacterium]MBV8486570.1 hypothetical protein [Verrucomicrobiota bacterium]